MSSGRKEPPVFRYKRWQLSGELRMLLRRLHKVEKFFPN